MHRALVLLAAASISCGTASSIAPEKVEPAEQFRLAGEHEEVGELILAWSEEVADTLERLIGLASPRVATTIIVDPSVGSGAVATR